MCYGIRDTSRYAVIILMLLDLMQGGELPRIMGPVHRGHVFSRAQTSGTSLLMIMLAHTQDLPNIFIPIHPFLFAYFSSLIESIENVFPGKVDIGWRSDQAPCLLAALCCPAQAEHTAAIVPAAMVSRSAIESPIVRGKNDIYCPTWENINTIKKSKTNYLFYKQTYMYLTSTGVIIY